MKHLEMPSAFYLLIVMFFPVYAFTTEKPLYPRWFLEQERVACPNASVGYATLSYYKHNGVLAAWNNAAENRVRCGHYEIQGGEAFTKTEHGTITEGKSYRETFDTTGLNAKKNQLRVFDSLFTPDCTIILAEDSSCQIPDELFALVDVSSSPIPDWITSIPNENGFLFSVGVEQQNYYEVSCWTEAEKDARLKLARSYGVRLQAQAKMSTYSGQEVQNEEMSVAVHNAEIIRRWRDINDNIYYVLMRCRISQ